MKSVSFNPIINNKCKVLILGTMPGIKSLEEAQYYAHKQNAFWPIIYRLFNEEISENYLERKKFVLKNKIALWDTLHFCYRKGSLDSQIKEEQPNEITKLLKDFPSIHSIIFNGKAAEKYFNRYFSKNESISYYTMPSTSPANAKKSFNEKLSDWTMVKDLLKY